MFKLLIGANSELGNRWAWLFYEKAKAIKHCCIDPGGWQTEAEYEKGLE